MSEYTQACRALLYTCGDCKKDEKLLIVTDESSLEIAQIFWNEASEFHNRSMIMMEDRKMHGDEPTALVAAAMMECDIMFRITKFSLSHAKARRKALANGCRDINMCDYSLETLTMGGLFADFIAAGKVLDKFWPKYCGEQITITTKKGTHLVGSIVGRTPKPQYGRSLVPGQVASPPDIECAIAAVEGELNGTLIIDGSIPMPGLGVLREDIKLTVEKSRVVKIEGGEEAGILERALKEFNDENVYMVSELAVTFNPLCHLTGRMLEDEGCYHSAHAALGSNTGFGGTITCPVHIDMIFLDPTVVIDGRTLVQDGNILE